MVAILDIEISNLASVLQALQRVGLSGTPTKSAADVDAAKAVILPGVGAFGDGMGRLRDKGLVEPLQRAAKQGKPLFGICLGMQLLAERSDEHGSNEGLGLIAGEVRRLPQSPSYRVPNIGWCDVTPRRPGVLFPKGPEDARAFYFVHSYHFQAKDPGVVAATIGGVRAITAAVETGNLFGAQFHPEKSQDAGLDMLFAFLTHLRKTGCHD